MDREPASLTRLDIHHSKRIPANLQISHAVAGRPMLVIRYLKVQHFACWRATGDRCAAVAVPRERRRLGNRMAEGVDKSGQVLHVEAVDGRSHDQCLFRYDMCE